MSETPASYLHKKFEPIFDVAVLRDDPLAFDAINHRRVSIHTVPGKVHLHHGPCFLVCHFAATPWVVKVNITRVSETREGNTLIGWDSIEGHYVDHPEEYLTEKNRPLYSPGG